MANTNTLTTLVAGKNEVVIHLAMFSDGTEETDLVIYDSSAVATTLGLTDSLNCSILEIHSAISSNTAATTTPQMRLEFDATTDVMAWSLPVGQGHYNFRKIGGLKNTSGTGITGDITLTSVALQASDNMSLVLIVRPY